MSYLNSFFPESKFGGFSDIDGTIAFYGRVNALISSKSTVVDFGCGRGEYEEDPIAYRRNLRILKGKVAKVIGLDVDEAARVNQFIDEFKLLEDSNWPIGSDSVDLIVCDNVIEHLKYPSDIFEEARRVLKPGGYLCIRTPNAWSYVALISRLIPNRFHGRIVGWAQEQRNEVDVFPTLYLCNTRKQLRKRYREAGFSHVVYGFSSEPCYLSFSKIAYGMVALCQQWTPNFLRDVLFGFGRLDE